jgi:hypothetical protein
MNCPDVAELFRLWTAGVTQDEIGERFGVSRNIVLKTGPPRRARFAPVEIDPTPEEIEERKREVLERRIHAMREAR